MVPWNICACLGVYICTEMCVRWVHSSAYAWRHLFSRVLVHRGKVGKGVRFLALWHLDYTKFFVSFPLEIQQPTQFWAAVILFHLLFLPLSIPLLTYLSHFNLISFVSVTLVFHWNSSNIISSSAAHQLFSGRNWLFSFCSCECLNSNILLEDLFCLFPFLFCQVSPSLLPLSLYFSFCLPHTHKAPVFWILGSLAYFYHQSWKAASLYKLPPYHFVLNSICRVILGPRIHG